MRKERAAVGFTVKSGWTAAVLIGGSAESPRVLDVRRLELSDPAVPDSRQPYHDGFGTARAEGRELSRLIASVERFARRSVTSFLSKATDAVRPLHGAGIVVGSTNDPSRIGNAHIRIHALEGQLFRRVVETAAAEHGLACAIWRERDLYAAAAVLLGQPETALRARVAELGKTADAPWRAEQKAAALAAWLVLASSAVSA
jgi:hypothetical protein